MNKNNQWDHLFFRQKSQVALENENKQPESISRYIFIFDCFENEIIFSNNAVTTITGYASEKFTLDLFIDIIHPEDKPYFFSCEEKGLDFTNQLSYNEHFRYILSYSFRIRTLSGEYIRVLQQCQALEVNDSGHLTMTLVTHKIMNEKKEEHLDYKIFDKAKNSYIHLDNWFQLTKREIEVLELIKNGHNSASISLLLNISKNTVITHRKNILTKTKSKSFIELMKKISSSSY